MTEDDVVRYAREAAASVQRAIDHGASDLDVMDIICTLTDWYLDYRREESVH